MTAQYDLLVRSGLVADGSGRPAWRGDIAVRDGWIVATGDIDGEADQVIEAPGLLVTPGFVDLHTHYDGQAIWSERMSPSSDHGVTTVLTGNCGIGFAPCRPGDHDQLVSLMEGVEDIPEAVATAGLTWDWETFPQYLDAVDRRPHDIDIATLLPHSPLRAYVMGARGIAREPARPDDLERMGELVGEALTAGALGFGTSRVAIHRTSKGEQIPSFEAAEAELDAICEAMRRHGSGIFQVVPNAMVGAEDELRLLERIAERSGRPVTYTQAQPRAQSDIFDRLAQANSRHGVVVRAQMFPRPIGLIVGLGTSVNPFSLCPSYRPLLSLTQPERVKALRDPELRRKLVIEPPDNPSNPVFLMSRRLDAMFPIGRDHVDYEPSPDDSVAARARRLGVTPEELCYDLLLEEDGQQLLMVAIANYSQGNLDYVSAALRDENVVLGLGDGGAHYGMICDGSYTTFALTHWTRDRGHDRFKVEKMVRHLSRRPAELIGLRDRGLIAPGHRADLNIIDYERLRLHPPELRRDLPGGGLRLHQRADGYVATIVAGQVVAENGTATNARPGRLVRGAQEARPAEPAY
jgi:N-acyl-D-aspartate/D-glutamate deacylase